MQATIEQAFSKIHQFNPDSTPKPLKSTVLDIIERLNTGQLRVAEKQGNTWITYAWIKQAILLYFRLQPCTTTTGFSQFYDKIPLKFCDFSADDFKTANIRIVPPATVRHGAYIASNTVLMPCYINLGAYVDAGSMIDTWATIGSCAQIGKNVHISGGAGIGGVLEPLQANPTIIEDNCFIGARSEIVEGVIVEENSVIAMGVFLSQSTPIYNRITQTTTYGRIPSGSVVVPGTIPSKTGDYQRSAAIIVKTVDAQTRKKTAINDLLRAIHD